MLRFGGKLLGAWSQKMIIHIILLSHPIIGCYKLCACLFLDLCIQYHHALYVYTHVYVYAYISIYIIYLLSTLSVNMYHIIMASDTGNKL